MHKSSYKNQQHNYVLLHILNHTKQSETDTHRNTTPLHSQSRLHTHTHTHTRTHAHTHTHTRTHTLTHTHTHTHTHTLTHTQIHTRDTHTHTHTHTNTHTLTCAHPPHLPTKVLFCDWKSMATDQRCPVTKNPVTLELAKSKSPSANKPKLLSFKSLESWEFRHSDFGYCPEFCLSVFQVHSTINFPQVLFKNNAACAPKSTVDIYFRFDDFVLAFPLKTT